MSCTHFCLLHGEILFYHNSRKRTPQGCLQRRCHFPPYLPAHLDSNSGPLLHTHGQLCSILQCYSWFHSRKQPIPWHKLSSCISTQNWVLLQVSRKHTKAWTKLHLVSCWTVYFKEYNFFSHCIHHFMKPLIKFCRNLWCFCLKNTNDPHVCNLSNSPLSRTTNILHLVPFFSQIQ